MAYEEYITKVHLLRVPLENDYKHTLYFTSKKNQEDYFKSKRVAEYSQEDFYYQRKDQSIKMHAHIDEINQCNYVMYQNSHYSNKWFYCFIKDMKYINDETTEIIIETDVIQTWLFDYKLKPSFIEREHVKDDAVGLHTVPEGLETGEYKCNELARDNKLDELVYIMLVTEWIPIDGETNPDKPLAVNMGGIFSAGGCYVCTNMEQVVNIVQAFDGGGKSDSIFALYMIPKAIINHDWESGLLQFGGQSKPVTYNVEFTKQKDLDTYKPRNNKLLCYPYNYLLMSNNAGVSNILQYEHFANDKCQFEVAGVPTIGGSIKCTPIFYKGLQRIQEEGIMCGKFPTLSWSSDLFTNWITQNSVNIGLGIASSGITIAGGIGMMLNPVSAIAGGSAVVSGVMGIASTLGQVHQQSFTPNSAKGNVNGGDINTCYEMNNFYFYKMSIKREYAEIIDKYFDAYGYKVNMIKTPNVAHRSRYWFTKTIDANIDGNIPNNDMQKIKDCYNNGITFWRNAEEIQNYNLSNDIV